MRAPLRLLIVSILIMTASSAMASLYLSPDGTGDYADIQSAVNASADGDTIFLAGGLYSGTGNRDIEIYSNVILKALDPANVPVIACDGSSLFPHQGFYIETCEPIIDGLTIRDGYGDEGGAVRILEANPIFLNCLFFKNESSADGGAVFASDDSYPVFEHCIFDLNSASGKGGAVFATSYSEVQIIQCTIFRSSAQSGSGVFLEESANCALDGSIIAFGLTGVPCSDYYGGLYSISCTNIAMNRDGDWVQSISGLQYSNNNLHADPLFCDPLAIEPNFHLTVNSPSNGGGCSWQGALPADPAWVDPVYGVLADDQGQFPNIQTAIDNVGSGAHIALADGTYNGPGNRDLEGRGKLFILRARGDNPAACILDCQGSAAAPHRVFNFHENETLDTIIQGLTLTGGYQTTEPGGAVLFQGESQVAFIDCRFVDNEAGGIGGGAVAVTGFSPRPNPRFTGCTFENNISQTDGGAVFGQNWSPYFHECEFRNNHAGHNGGDLASVAGLTGSFVNTSFENGTAVYGHSVHLKHGINGTSFVDCFFSSPLTSGSACLFLENQEHLYLTTCRFEGNGGIIGGAIHAEGGSYTNDMIIQSCDFIDNNAENMGGLGGGIYAESVELGMWDCNMSGNLGFEGGAIYGRDSEIYLESCVLEGNGANTGAALKLTRCNTTINSCRIEGNEATNGSGVYMHEGITDFSQTQFLLNSASNKGGALYGGSSGSPTVVNSSFCTFAQNEASGGTVLSTNMHIEARFENCTMHDNSDTYSSIDGGQITIYSTSHADLVRCLITDGQGVSAVKSVQGGTAIAVDCNIYNNSLGNFSGPLEGLLGLAGNISAHPLQCDPEGFDFTLGEHSYCLPANNNAHVLVGAFEMGCLGPSPVQDENLPTALNLVGNFPNPFNPSTRIVLVAGHAESIDLRIYDAKGGLVRTLVDDAPVSPGEHSFYWDGRDNAGKTLASGAYFCRVRAGKSQDVLPMILIK